MSALSRIAAGGMLVCAVYAAAACNAVLGIEQAELDTAAAPACTPGQGLTLAECAPLTSVTSCEMCVGRSCSAAEVTSCLGNPECRKALVNYRTCQQDNCRDPSGSCAGCLEVGPGTACFAECAAECQGTEVVDLCDIFCTCMEANCASRPSVLNCRDDCHNSHMPWRTNCRLTHCELATPMTPDHCLHASDELQACPTEPPAAQPNCKPPKRLVGYACTDRDDCCSGICNSGRCGV